MIRKFNKVVISFLLLIVSILFVGCNNKNYSENDEISKPSHSEEAIGENIDEPLPWDYSDN